MTTFTYNNAAQAVARARTHKTWPKGMCLNHVWDCVSSQTKSYGLYDANAGWAAATLKRYDRNPPAGAPVYWAGYSHGHIAISVGGGKVRSTDCPSDGVVSELSIAAVTTRWPGLTYRGYSLDFAGDWIAGIAPTPPEDIVLQSDKDYIVNTVTQKVLAGVADAVLWAPDIPNNSSDPLDAGSVRNTLSLAYKNAKQSADATDALTKLVTDLAKQVATLQASVNALPKA